MSENNKNTHKGRAAEYFAMSQLLLRGWNVSVPVVDVGDDVLIIDDRKKLTHRMQVRSSTASPLGPQQRDKLVTKVDNVGSFLCVTFQLSREQLRVDPPTSKLFYFLLTRSEGSTAWTFFVISRARMAEVKDELEAPGRPKGRGRPRLPDEMTEGTNCSFTILYNEKFAYCGEIPFTPHLNQWPDELPQINDGPGTRSVTAAPAEPPPLSQDPRK